MRAFVPSVISEDEVIPIASLRISVGLQPDDDSLDPTLQSIALQAVALVEEETGVILREQDGQIRCTAPTATESRLGTAYDLLSPPVFCKNIIITGGSYWSGSEYSDFDLDDVEVVTGPRLCWKHPDDFEGRTDAFLFDVSLEPIPVTGYLARLVSLVSWMYLRSNHPDYTAKLDGILNSFKRGL